MWSLVLVSCVGIVAVSAYSSGPPTGACKSMQPGPPHQPNSIKTKKQKKNPPFNLEAIGLDNGQVKGKAKKCGKIICFWVYIFSFFFFFSFPQRQEEPDVPWVYDHGRDA